MALCDLLDVSLSEVLPEWPSKDELGIGTQSRYTSEMNKVLICGFMGSGKTTLLRRLKDSDNSHNSDMEFLDLDELIFQKNAKSSESMGEMILRLGWKKFRDEEQRIFKELVEDESRSFLLALGGGGLQGNLEWLKQWQDVGEVALVWLDTPLTRCLNQARRGGNRPLLQKSNRELGELYAKRLVQYSQADISLTPQEQERVHTWEQLQALFKK
jgi:shikimate kinase